MVYYNINNITTKSIKILEYDISKRISCFDRNGKYYVILNEIDTKVYEINNKLKYIFPISSIVNNISENYKKLYCRSNDYIKLYDFNNGNELYSIPLHHLRTGGMSLSGDYIFYSDNINTIKIINDNFEYIYNHEFLEIEEHEEFDTDIDLILFAVTFHSNNKLVAIHFPTYILIIDMIKNNIKKIENIMFDENDRYNYDPEYYVMEFTKDGKHLIVKYSDYNIKVIDYTI